MTNETKKFIDDEIVRRGEIVCGFWELLATWIIDMKDPTKNYWMCVLDDVEEFVNKYRGDKFAMELALAAETSLGITAKAVKEFENESTRKSEKGNFV